VYVYDLETTTDENDCRVWAWGCYGIDDNVFTWGKDIRSMMNDILVRKVKTVYFHNLKFDGDFVFNWLFREGFKFRDERKLNPGEFHALISDMDAFYSIKINLFGHLVTMKDSLKIIPLPVRKIPAAYGLESLKGDIDYKKDRPVGYDPTPEEIEYIKNDVKIVAHALKAVFNSGLTKLTQASNALSDYKKTIGKKWDMYFPQLTCDRWLRRSYKGGYTFAKREIRDKDVGAGSVYDVNSLYPSVMYNKMMPWGEPVWFDGEYQHDKYFPLFIMAFTCNFKLKSDHLPILQIKNNSRFLETEYLDNNDGDEDATMLTLTSVDYKLFREHYDIRDIEFIGGYKFMARNDMFKGYIDKWNGLKVSASIAGNDGMRTIAKLMLNSLYGKFGMNPEGRSKHVGFNSDVGMTTYYIGSTDIRKPLYVAVASFITAYAREVTIRAAQLNYDRFMYCDTDSIHISGTEPPEGIEVHPEKLGAWKHEKNFTRARFVRAKTYIEMVNWDCKKGDIPEKMEVTCAGLPKDCHDYVTFDNFHPGLVVPGKLQHKRVPGGVVLRDTSFKMKEGR
jgi:hypothetical protein